MSQPHTQRLLERLDAIGHALEKTGNALALLALGSVGTETARLDDYSDLDFFAIVRAGCKRQFIDNLDWLAAIHPVAYAFQNTVDGYKLLYEDYIFCEFAVFEPQELSGIPFGAGRLIWKAPDFDESVCVPRPRPPAEQHSVDWMLGEALTNLYVGLGRYRRGEKLSAAAFIQNYAVHQVLNLAALLETAQPGTEDQFDKPRRFEQRFPGIAARLPQFMQGYERSCESALAILAFLEEHFEVNPFLKAAIIRLAS
jgi:hypothetical protein